jgi:hypothetical protein
MWEPRRLTTIWALTACYMNSFLPLFVYVHVQILTFINSPFFVCMITSIIFSIWLYWCPYCTTCFANANTAPLFFILLIPPLYLRLSDFHFCPIQNNIKSISIMTNSHLLAGTQETHKVSGILYVLQTVGNGECPTYPYTMSTTVTKF